MMTVFISCSHEEEDQLQDDDSSEDAEDDEEETVDETCIKEVYNMMGYSLDAQQNRYEAS